MWEFTGLLPTQSLHAGSVQSGHMQASHCVAAAVQALPKLAGMTPWVGASR